MTLTPVPGQGFVYPISQIPTTGFNRLNSESAINYTSTQGNQTAIVAEYVFLQNQGPKLSNVTSQSLKAEGRDITITMPSNSPRVSSDNSCDRVCRIISLTLLISGVAFIVLGIQFEPPLVFFGMMFIAFAAISSTLASPDGRC